MGCDVRLLPLILPRNDLSLKSLIYDYLHEVVPKRRKSKLFPLYRVYIY